VAKRHLSALPALLALTGALLLGVGCDGGSSAATSPKQDKSSPTTPGDLSASHVTARRVTLRWERSKDDVGVARYVVRRNGIDLTDVPARMTRYTVEKLDPDTEYQFTIAAVDGAGNRSKESSAVTVETTLALARQRLVFRAVADAYVNELRPYNAYGLISRKLRMDGAPNRRSYVRFDVSGLKGRVTEATLLLYANKGSARGYFVHPVAPVGWDEASITFASAPRIAKKAAARSGPFPPEAWTEAQIRELVEGDGPLTVALTTDDITLISIASRETVGRAPRLIVKTERPLGP
jgi:hypothetical protein